LAEGGSADLFESISPVYTAAIWFGFKGKDEENNPLPVRTSRASASTGEGAAYY
jgi:hypothetical protein